MKTKDFIIRINYKDFRRAKKFLRPYPRESMADYFMRLINRIEKLKNDRR